MIVGLGSLYVVVKKVACTFVQAVRPIGGVEVWLYSFLTTALEGGEGVSVTPRPLFTPGKDPVPIVQRLGGPTGAENLAPTRIQSPDRPARSQLAHSSSGMDSDQL